MKNAKLQKLMAHMKTNMEILENAIEKGHTPNTYATLATSVYQLKEMEKIALKDYKDWQDGKID